MADLFPSPPSASAAAPPPPQPQQAPAPERPKGGSLPPPPNVVGMLWELTLNAGRMLGAVPRAAHNAAVIAPHAPRCAARACPGVPVPDADLPKSPEEKARPHAAANASAPGSAVAQALASQSPRPAPFLLRRALPLGTQRAASRC